jgi:predicted RNase H-like nuclease (RuvC/YqgF family)
MTDKVQEAAEPFPAAIIREFITYAQTLGANDRSVEIAVNALDTLLSALKERDERIERLEASFRSLNAPEHEAARRLSEYPQMLAEVEQLRKVAEEGTRALETIATKTTGNWRSIAKRHERTALDALCTIESIASLPHKEGEE